MCQTYDISFCSVDGLSKKIFEDLVICYASTFVCLEQASVLIFLCLLILAGFAVY